MLRRSFVGLIEGLVIGIALAVAAVRGLGWSAPSALYAALLAASAGFLVGLVAGRPIWARDAKTEALLKAAVGALVGVGSSLALGHWLSLPLDLGAYALGAGPAGKLVVVSLPLISTLLALFFELDDSDRNAPKPHAEPRLRASTDLDEPAFESEPEVLAELPAEREREKR